MSKKPETVFLKDYQSPCFAIDSLDLSFKLYEDRTIVRSKMLLRKTQTNANSLSLHGEQLELIEIILNDTTLADDAYQLTDTGLTILDVPEQFELQIENEIHPEKNTALSGLYRSGGMFCTQCEAEGFRRITYFIDRPDVMTSFTTSIEADKEKYPVLLSNGNLIETRDLEEGRHFVKWEDPFKKPSYLFALVAGDLACTQDSFTTTSGREIDLYIYVDHGNEHKSQHALDSLKKSMRWDEKTFGREYDLDIFMIVAVNDFNMGAMENKGLNIFNTQCALADPKSATDREFLSVESVIAHEYFHNWTGNRVTCRDWFQLSLKEGLTVYRDQEFSCDMHSRSLMRIRDVRLLRMVQFPEDAGPMAHPVRPESYMEINNFYTATIYNKGAEVIRMMRTLVGFDGFRKATDLYFERHDGQAVTINELVDAVEDANKVDLTQFRKWYQIAGTPYLEIKTLYNDATKTYKINIVQDCPATPGQDNKPPLHIPLRIGLLNRDGQDMELFLTGDKKPKHGNVLELKERQHEFTFVHVDEMPVPSFAREFSAPIRVKYDYSDRDLAFLLAQDNDHFNRYNAGQSLLKRVMLQLVGNCQNTTDLVMPELVLESFSNLLNDTEMELDLLAECVMLPQESELNDLLDVVDVDAIHTAATFVKAQLADKLQNQWLSLYHQNRMDSYELSHTAMAKRAIKNISLHYLVQTQTSEAIDLCYTQFKQADNMTDMLAALSSLCQVNCDERRLALDAFYEQWSHDLLVVDKWLAVQANAQLPDTLFQVKALMAHEAFTLKNPNKVRSLVGSFTRNQSCFHDKTGEGYIWLADIIIELNTLNPQIAARLVTPLQRWRRFDENRASLMQAELQRIRDTENLSSDVFEMVDKAL